MTGSYVPLRDAIDQLFEGSFITPQLMAGHQAFPPVDVHLTEDDLVLEMAVPGAQPDDINISVTGETVTVTGEIKREQHGQKGQQLAEEIWRGRFQRSFQVPIQVDANKAEASFENGILTLMLPKSEANKPRKIQIRQSSGSSGGKGGGQKTIKSESVSVSDGSSA
jgi:HSP20 family protein